MKLTTKDTEDTEREFSIIHRWIERNHPDGFIDSLSYSQNLERVTDRWYNRFDELERERDQAREELEHWKIEYDIVEARLRGIKHERDNGIISENEVIPKLKRERNQARDQVEELTAVIKGLRAIMRQDATK
jgi:predicted nuclease with TOPRIM domain